MKNKYLPFISQHRIRDFIINKNPEVRPVLEGKAFYLDKNENPYNIYGQRYPQNRFIEPTHWELRKKIAEIYSLAPENIFIQHGYWQALDLLLKIFSVVESFFYLKPVPEELKRFLVLHNVKKRIIVSYNSPWAISYRANAPRFAWVMNPMENVSKNLEGLEIALDTLKPGNFLFLDERYIEFSEARSFLQKATEVPGFLVLRSFSFAYALAGLSLNFVVAEKELIDLLYLFREPESVSRIATQYLLEILTAKEAHTETVKMLRKETRNLYRELKKLPFVKEILAPDAHFIMVKFENNEEVFQALREKKIVVYRGENFLRISVGNETENKYLIRILQKLF